MEREAQLCQLEPLLAQLVDVAVEKRQEQAKLELQRQVRTEQVLQMLEHVSLLAKRLLQNWLGSRA